MSRLWFQNHLNLSLGLLYVVWLIVFGAVFLVLFGWPIGSSELVQNEFRLVYLIILPLQIIYLSSLMLVNWWVLKQKKRNYNWLLLVFFVPLGLVSTFVLKNKSVKSI